MSQARKAPFLFGSRAGLLRALAFSLLVAAACGLLALTVDREIALGLREGLSKETRNAFLPITDLGKADWYIVALIAAYGLGRLAFLRAAPLAVAQAWYALSRVSLYLMASLALSGALLHTLKILVGRMRPKMLFREGLYGAEPFGFNLDFDSFPSGHSQTIWVLMSALTILWPKGAPVFLGWAVLVSSSRVIVGAHFPSDVLMGSFIGIMSALYVKQKWFDDLSAPNFRRYLNPEKEAVS